MLASAFRFRMVILSGFLGVSLFSQNLASAEEELLRLDARRAQSYLVKICRIGRRVSGTEGMAKQQQMIVDHFSKLGAKVLYQPFDVAHPLTGKPVRMANIIVSWNPEAKDRILLCTHYDTRPYPDQDRVNPRGVFLGANDGASGVALFMEMGNHMKKVKSNYGVDFVFFDGEELIYKNTDKYFLGSEHFAKKYKSTPPPFKYHTGILLDMVGDRRLNIYYETFSLKYAPAVVKDVWASAKAVGVREFIPQEKFEVRDDHLPLNEIAKIPTIDLIDFDYPYWHTTKDIPANCSGTSMIKVGKVLLHYITHLPAPRQ